MIRRAPGAPRTDTPVPYTTRCRSYGYLTATGVVQAADAAVADEKLRLAARAIEARGFVVVPETLNSVEAWLSSLPGHVYANVRQWLVSTLNLAHQIGRAHV